MPRPLGQAIITVKQDSSARRKRFSIAHELGHWRFHRVKTLVCRVDEYRPRDAQSPEKVADGYAADLLIPHYLFALRAAALDRIAFDSIGGLGQAFKTSLTATAIYPVDRNTPCAMRRESTPYVEYRCQFSLTYSAMPRAGLYNG